MSEESPKRMGDYELLSVLGAGGMGRVYKVRNVISDRIEAMKILLPDLAGEKDLAERFLREIKVLAALNHPNIAPLRTALTFDNQLVMIMEYVEGITLAARLKEGPIPAQDALNYIDQVLQALRYAHEQKVVHRDIKPANMMLTPEGVVKLMDFGIARSGSGRGLTMTGTTLGSLYYMSPEQVKGVAIDARSDLYSVGVSLYEMVTGQRPFQSDSDFAILAAHLQEPPRPPIELRPDLPRGLNDVILKAMAKDPSQRFQSADAFRVASRDLRLGQAAAATAGQAAPAFPTTPLVTTTVLDHSASAAARNDSAPAPIGLPSQPQPQVTPSVLEMSARAGSSRGLYMAFGALIVLAVLVIAGIYVPRRNKTSAEGKANRDSQQSVTSSPSGAPGSSAAATSNPGTVGDTTGATSGGATGSLTTNSSSPQSREEPSERSHFKPPVQAGSRQRLVGSSSALNSHANQQDSASLGEVQGSETVPDSNQIQELEQEIVGLSSRAGAVNDSLEHMRQEQGAHGFALRSDISSSQQRMAMYMAKAQTALQNQDTKTAKKNLDLAEPELEKLENFLGR